MINFKELFDKGVVEFNDKKDLILAHKGDFINVTKLQKDLKQEEEKKDNCKAILILAIIGGICVIAAIAYGLYRFFSTDYDEFEDYPDDEFDDDFFEDDDEDDDEDEVEEAEEASEEAEEKSEE